MNAPFQQRLRPSDHVYRAAAAMVLAIHGKTSPDKILRGHHPEDRVTPLILRAATSPAALTDAGWAGNLAQAAVADFVVGLAPQSAAAELIARAMRVSLAGRGSITVPLRVVAAADAGGFVAEGAPIQVRSLNVLGGPNLSPSKFGVIAPFTREMLEASPTDFETIVKQMLGEASALALDAAVLSNTAASAIRPAGILNGIAALAATAGGGMNALTKDVESLVGALAAAGVGKEVVFIAATPQAMAMKLWAGPRFDSPILASAALAAGTVIAVDPASFATAFDAVPLFDTADAPVIHSEDTTPLAIGTAGAPNTVAAPTRALWQTDCLAIKLLLRTAWAMRAAGSVQFITGTTW